MALIIFLPSTVPPTMLTPAGLSSLVPPSTNYQEYFSRINSDTFHGFYANILESYGIDPTAAANTPDNVARLIYSTAHEGVPTAFLQWHHGLKGGGAHRNCSSTWYQTTYQGWFFCCLCGMNTLLSQMETSPAASSPAPIVR